MLGVDERNGRGWPIVLSRVALPMGTVALGLCAVSTRGAVSVTFWSFVVILAIVQGAVLLRWRQLNRR